MDKPREDGYIRVDFVNGTVGHYRYEDIPEKFGVMPTPYGLEVCEYDGGQYPVSRTIYPWHTVAKMHQQANSDGYQIALAEWQDSCEHEWGDDIHGLIDSTCYKQCERCGRTMPLHDGREHSADDMVE